MIDVSTDEGKSELIAKLRRREEAGLIGQHRYFNPNDMSPCCLVGHMNEIFDVRQGEISLREANDWDFDILNNLTTINDESGPTVAIDVLASRLGVTE